MQNVAVDLEAVPLGVAQAHIVEAVAVVGAVEDGSVVDHHQEVVALTIIMETPHILVEDITLKLDPPEAEIPKVSSGARRIITMGL